MSRLTVRGKYIFEGPEKFYIRGVSYGPFTPNSSGERYPEPARAAADFALMRAMNANVVRLYVPPPEWLVEEAARASLRLMVGIPWPFHMTILDSEKDRREVRESIAKAVTELRAHGDSILAYSLGNEIRSDVVRWHGPRVASRFLAELYDVGKQVAPDALFTYSNYPSTEYLDLSFLDFISFNVYLHNEEDYRRYLTHLMAQAGDRPLVLSETGMDTIREGEAHQAELLSWQARAAFEIGLSGFIVFAFTDEWHTGGAEITDWAFGLTRRDRTPKPAFETVGKVFKQALPPALEKPPKASVVVATYNAAETLADCLESLRELKYPDYETIVVDDGSADATPSILEEAGVHAIRTEHRGLAAARNTGADAATGEIVAYIDADARADCDWLYHLVEAIRRRDAAAAGGPNFAPLPDSARAAALAAAPGLPREVRGGDDLLAQLCGCNMAITTKALRKAGGFDTVFTGAGDDVDLSWRLAAAGEKLVYAPGATVIHQPRATLGAYLVQQRGYGIGEGLLFRKYPLKNFAEGGMYAGPSWIGSLFGGARVYYGAFGHGLFQTVYSAGGGWAELPLTIQWIGLSALILALGAFSRLAGVVGGAGLVLSLSMAAAAAAATPLPGAKSSVAARLHLFIISLLGPAVRSTAREHIKWRFEPSRGPANAAGTIELGGVVGLAKAEREDAPTVESPRVLAVTREALVRRGLAVAETDGFQSYDLQIIVPPFIRVPLNAIRSRDGVVSLRWRVRIAPRRAVVTAAIVLVALVAAGLSIRAGILAFACAAIGVALFAISRMRWIGSIVRESGAEAARILGLRVVSGSELEA